MSDTSRKCAVKVSFKRRPSSPVEYGISIGADPSQSDAIIDARGRVVGEVWSYEPAVHSGLIWWELVDL